MIRFGAILGLLMCVLPIGCGGEQGLGKVEGVVKLDGKPLPDASVEFTPADGKGLTSYGRTDQNGAYYMMATRSDYGAALGKNKVRISTYEITDTDGKRTVIQEKVPIKYNQSTELEADVQSGSNSLDFDLKTEGSKVAVRRETPE